MNLHNYKRRIKQTIFFLLCLATPPAPSSLPRQLSNAVPPGAIPEEYLRSFRPYATTEDSLRMQSLPLGLDPAAAAAAAAYYHPSYLPHPSFTPYRSASYLILLLTLQFLSDYLLCKIIDQYVCVGARIMSLHTQWQW